MDIRWATLAAGALIALAILFTNRWQIATSPAAVLRLDRWTGDVVLCNTAVSLDPENGTKLNCEMK